VNELFRTSVAENSRINKEVSSALLTRYRRDIDGLRALAVCVVLLFHAPIAVFSGGYVGVDVFFVLSGFLITQLILEQDARGTFRFATFYQVRAWRILPALVVMTTATVFAAAFILGPQLFSSLAASAIATLLFAPNVYFALHQTYFESSAAEPALLHTWTLGLEEQFYALFPLLLIALLRNGRGRTSAFLLGGCLFSLALCVWLVGNHPTATFYLLPTRAWEFLLGALTFLWPAQIIFYRCWGELLAALGVVAIVVAATTLTPGIRYPGLIAITPCLGACAILAANARGSTLVKRVLSLPVFVSIGRISYSLYLWHWPIFVFGRQVWRSDSSAVRVVACFGITIIVATLSWRYVEEPLRLRPSSGGRRRGIMPLFGATIAGLCCACLVIVCAGFPTRLPSQAVRYEGTALQEDNRLTCHHGVPELVSSTGICKLHGAGAQNEVVLVWGDSHANVVAPIVAELGVARGMTVMQATYSSCPPLIGLKVAAMPRAHHCVQFNEMVIGAARTLKVRRAVLAAYWSTYLQAAGKARYVSAFDPYGTSDDLGAGSLPQNVARLRAALNGTVKALRDLGIRVWVLQQVPEQERFVPEILAQAEWWTGSAAAIGIPLAEYRANQTAAASALMSVEGVEGLLDPASMLCREGWCLAAAGGESLYRDANHLSAIGAARLKPILSEVFD
jgi:peptidoglycan/LPS O-acetylase OafA/YrhL